MNRMKHDKKEDSQFCLQELWIFSSIYESYIYVSEQAIAINLGTILVRVSLRGRHTDRYVIETLTIEAVKLDQFVTYCT